MEVCCGNIVVAVFELNEIFIIILEVRASAGFFFLFSFLLLSLSVLAVSACGFCLSETVSKSVVFKNVTNFRFRTFLLLGCFSFNKMDPDDVVSQSFFLGFLAVAATLLVCQCCCRFVLSVSLWLSVLVSVSLIERNTIISWVFLKF